MIHNSRVYGKRITKTTIGIPNNNNNLFTRVDFSRFGQSVADGLLPVVAHGPDAAELTLHIIIIIIYLVIEAIVLSGEADDTS